MLLLKGAALALTHYEEPATWPMADIDVLVPASRVQAAARCLEQDGFCLRPLPRSRLPSMNRPHVHFAYVHAATGAVVELHWELQALRRVLAEALAEIWAHARPADCGDTARVMCPGHTIPFLCAHLTLQHRWAPLTGLYDLHRVLLSLSGADAARARDAATRWQLVPCTARTLLRVRELFGTPLPDELSLWAQESRSDRSAQARVAALALVPGTPGMPDEGLVRLFLNQEWRLLRSLFPAPEVVRERCGLAADQSVLPAYLALLARRFRSSPARFRHLWRCLWDRGAP